MHLDVVKLFNSDRAKQPWRLWGRELGVAMWIGVVVISEPTLRLAVGG